MYAVVLLLTGVGACGTGMYGVETGGCCGYAEAVVCRGERCCPGGMKCTPDGQLCEGNASITPSLPITAYPERDCMSANSRLRVSLQTAISNPSFTAFLSVLDTYMQGKEACDHRVKLALSPSTCMVDFLLLETDTRVTYWNLAKGELKSAFSSFLNVLIWIPYLHADCLV